jgi:hypothetical protein
VRLGELRVDAGSDLAAAALPSVTPVAAGTAGPLALLGHGPLPTEPVPAGSVVDLDLWWRAENIHEDLATRLTLGDTASGALVGELATPLGAPGSGSARWPAAPFTVRQRLRLPVQATAAGGNYELAVSLLGPDGAPLPGAAPVELGVLEVEPRDMTGVLMERPGSEARLDATFGDVAQLVGVDIGPHRAGSGNEVEWPVRLVWQALAGAGVPYHVTVQMLDEDRRPVAQHDGAPADGRRPVPSWIPGEYVVDEHILKVPADLPPGGYCLIAAMYDPATLARLPTSRPNLQGNAVLVGRIKVGGGPGDCSLR